MRIMALLRPAALRKHRAFLFSPPARSSVIAPVAENIHSKVLTLKSHILRAVMQTIMSVTLVTTSSTLALTPIRVTARVPTVPALARTAAAIHGCCKVSRPPPAPVMDTVIIAVPAGNPKARRSIPAVTVIAMARGSSIRPASIVAQALAGTAVQQTMTTLRTA